MSSSAQFTPNSNSLNPRRRLRPIPVPALSPFGRDDDISRVTRWYRDDARLVTLVGPPGSGKTRLALHVASTIEQSIGWPAVYVPLSTIASSDYIISSLAQSLDLTEDGHLPLDRLLSRLNRIGPLLVVLDRLEHLSGSSDVISCLLHGAPRLRLLATSRLALRITGERRFDVSPLPLPDPSESVDELSANPAVQLFTHRASGTSYAVTIADLPLVARICIQLSGLPLALELAAAQVPRIGIHNLLRHLEERDLVLDMGADSPDVRHRSLRSAVASSFDLLSENMQRAMALLSVFVGGFSAAEAERFLSGQIGIDSWKPAESTYARANRDAATLRMQTSLVPIIGSVPHVLQLLVEANLLQSSSGANGTIRYQMLDAIREYANCKLRETDEVPIARRSHSIVMTQFAWSACAALWTGKNRLSCMREFEVERGNLRVALDWAISSEGEDGFIAQSLAAATWFYLLRVGSIDESRTWLDCALKLTCDRTWASGLALNGLAFVAWSQGQFDLALRTARKIIESMESELNPIQLGAAHFTAGLAALRLGQRDEMVRHMEMSRPLLEKGGDLTSAGFALRALGSLARMQGEYDEAESLFQSALDRFESCGHEWGIATTLYNAGELASEQCDFLTASDCLTKSLEAFWALNDWFGAGHCVAGMALIAERRGEKARARRLIASALDSINDESTSFTPVDLAQYRTLAVAFGLPGPLPEDAREKTNSLIEARLESHSLRNEIWHGLPGAVRPDPLLDLLTGEQLDAVNLRCEGMTVEQIGNTLKRDRNTIYDRLHRARIRLNVSTNEELVARVAALRRGEHIQD